MQLTDKQINTLYSETHNYTDPDAYVSDMLTSSLLLDPEDPEQEIAVELTEPLLALWHVANDPFRALLERMGLTQTQCATRFCVPLRTVQDWAGDRREAAPYLRLMMAELTGVVRLHA